jgi:hypothetical protein
MSVIRVGSSGTYASGWDAVFGGRKGKKAASKAKKPVARTAKKAATKAAKKKPKRR